MTPDDKIIKLNWEKDMKTGHDYMKKASSILLSKPPESETNEDIVQPMVCYLYFYGICFNFF